MKKRILLLVTISVLLLSFAVGVFASDGTAKKRQTWLGASDPFVFKDSKGTDLPYRIYLPEDWETKKYPLVISLHGARHVGNDNVSHVTFAPEMMEDIINSEEYQAIIIAPQCGSGHQWVDFPWSKGSYSIEEVKISKYLSAVRELIDEMIDTRNVDTDRIYVTGRSMGGYGTWDLILRFPELFAAAVPICGGGDPSAAERIKDLPIWFFHGDKDPTVPVRAAREMADALEAVGSTVYYYYEYPGVDHYSWEPAFKEPLLLPWLFSQTKAVPETTPVTDAATTEPPVSDEPTAAEPSSSAMVPFVGVVVIAVGAVVVVAAVIVAVVVLVPKKKNK